MTNEQSFRVLTARPGRRVTAGFGRRGLLWTALLAVVSSPGLASAQGADNANGDPEVVERPARAVKVAPVAPAPAAAPMTFSGVVRAEKRAHLAFTLGGRMVRRPAEVGQAVKKNAVLAVLDLAPLENARAVAKAQLDDVEARLMQLRRDVQRERRLVGRGAGRRETLEKLISGAAATQAARDQARAGFAEAERQLNEARLRAPFAGTIIDVMLEPGEFARPGVAVVVLSAEDRLEVEVQVPEAIRAGLKTNMPVDIRLPLAGGQKLTGKVTQLGRGASGPGQLFPVVVGFAGTDSVAPGYTAELEFKVKTPDAVMLPVAAVADPGGHSPFVFRVRGGRAEKVPVRVLRLVGNQVTVSSDLAIGDAVIIKGHISLLADEPVEVLR